VVLVDGLDMQPRCKNNPCLFRFCSYIAGNYTHMPHLINALTTAEWSYQLLPEFTRQDMQNADAELRRLSNLRITAEIVDNILPGIECDSIREAKQIINGDSLRIASLIAVVIPNVEFNLYCK
jgi:hypothetical protein